MTISNSIPMIQVRDVGESIAFYQRLGFKVENTFVPPGQTNPTWAWLEAQSANIMVTLADEPLIASKITVTFYLYCDDVPSMRATLQDKGIKCGPITYPFYNPKGEFPVEDPDGYVLMLTHT